MERPCSRTARLSKSESIYKTLTMRERALTSNALHVPRGCDALRCRGKVTPLSRSERKTCRQAT
jgi:hypothetical protein